MRKLILCLFVIALLLLACGPHPASIQKTKAKKTDREVVIILSEFVDQYDYDSLGTVEVELKRRTTKRDMSLFELLFGLPILEGDNPWLTTTEELLTKLIKKAQSMGANAITNLELGSFDWYAHVHTEDLYNYKYIVYARATALLVHDLNLTK